MTAIALKQRLSSEERRQSIIEASAPLFAELGFRGVTTKTIARSAGVSEALLYQHFPSKENLYVEVQESLCQIPNRLLEIVTNIAPSPSGLIHIVFLHVKSLLEGAGREERSAIFTKLMLRSIMEDGDFARLFLERHVAPWQKIFQTHVTAAQDEGMLNNEVPEDICFWFCHHLIVQVNILQLPQQPVVDYGLRPSDLTTYIAKFLLRGMGLTQEAFDKYFDDKTLHAIEVSDDIAP